MCELRGRGADAAKFAGEVLWVWQTQNIPAAGRTIWKRGVSKAGCFSSPLKEKDFGEKTQAVFTAVAFLPNKFGQKSRENIVLS